MASFSLETLERFRQQASLFVETHLGLQLSPLNVVISIVAVWFVFALASFIFQKKSRPPPVVPGLPIIGNLLQLGEKKPHKTFTAWAQKYGPIYKIKTGVDTLVVINSSEIAKEAMVTKYSSISSRKMSKALDILTNSKCMVAMSDYGDEHRMLKKLVVNHLLAPIPQKANRGLRERTLFHMIDEMYAELKQYPGSVGTLNIRDYIKKTLFPFSMYQVLGREPEEIYVKEMGRIVSRWEIFDIFVMDPLKAVVEVDWRDFFPAFKWVPNKVEDNVRDVAFKRTAVIRALIAEQRQLLADGKKPNCYLDTLLLEAKHLTEKQLEMSAWEPIIESADTTLVTIEWIMYELAKNQAVQERLYKEIEQVVGARLVTEDDLPKLKYLDAIVKETLRFYPPVPLLPPRYVEKDVKLGGYDIKQGWQIVVNVYGINYNPKVWKEPGVWDPERVVGDEKLDMGYQDHRALPFGTGKRMCAGVTQAMYIIPMNVAFFVQHFKWALPPGQQPTSKGVVDTVYLTTHKLHPLQAIATPRTLSRLPSP